VYHARASPHPSAPIDTDTLIQRTIHEEFRGCTVITIAHRLNTIMDADRILVMHAGTMGEFDTPAALLAGGGGGGASPRDGGDGGGAAAAGAAAAAARPSLLMRLVSQTGRSSVRQLVGMAVSSGRSSVTDVSASTANGNAVPLVPAASLVVS
jgi:energy-coupling factor transporter ATP-binding protein EcfA2